jgi:hypothetical protein
VRALVVFLSSVIVLGSIYYRESQGGVPDSKGAEIGVMLVAENVIEKDCSINVQSCRGSPVYNSFIFIVSQKPANIASKEQSLTRVNVTANNYVVRFNREIKIIRKNGGKLPEKGGKSNVMSWGVAAVDQSDLHFGKVRPSTILWNKCGLYDSYIRAHLHFCKIALTIADHPHDSCVLGANISGLSEGFGNPFHSGGASASFSNGGFQMTSMALGASPQSDRATPKSISENRHEHCGGGRNSISVTIQKNADSDESRTQRGAHFISGAMFVVGLVVAIIVVAISIRRLD